MDDMAAMRKAEPWLFVDAPSSGATGLEPAEAPGAAGPPRDDPWLVSDGAWRPWAAGRGK